MITKYEKANGVKLFALVAVIAMVLAGAAVVFSDSEVNADSVTVSDLTELKNAISGDATEIIIDEDIDMSSETSAIEINRNVVIRGNVAGEPATITGNNNSDVTAFAISGSAVVTLENLVLTGFGKNTTNNAVIQAGTNEATFTGTLTIDNCVVKEFGKGGIVVKGGTATITNTTVDVTDSRSNKDNDRAPNGIQIDMGARATISGCTISNSESNTEEWTATGILSLRGGVVNVSSSTMEKCQTGFNVDNYYEWNGATGAGVGNSISSSEFDNCGSAISAGVATTATDTTFTGTNAIDGIITFDGTTTNNGALTNNANVVNNGVIRNNSTIDNKESISNYGQIINGTDGEISGDGDVIGNEPTKRIGIDSTLVGLEGDLVLDGEGFIAGNSDLVIPADKSIIIRSTGSLDLNGKNLVVQGKLVVETGGTVIDLNHGTNGIILSDNGAIENSGVIGYGDAPVSVKVFEDGTTTGNSTSVEMQNVEGLSFAVEKKYNSNTQKNEYALTLSGNVYATSGNVDTYKITINGAKVVGDLTVDADIAVGGTGVTLTKDSTLTMNGEMTCPVTMQNDSTFVIDGKVTGLITAESGKFNTYPGTVSGSNTVQLTNVEGITLSVSSTTYTEYDESEEQDVSKTEQALYISGTTELSDSDNTSAEIEITSSNGIAKVQDEAVLALAKGVDLVGGGIIVEGQIQYIKGESNVSDYSGTLYEITDAENRNTTNCYITNFTDALSVIDTVNKKTITVTGAVDVKDGFTLANGQTIVINGNEFNVDSDAKVTLEAGSVVTGKINEVKGIVFAQKNARHTAPNMYAVEGTNAETGDKTYAGFEAAIENSAAGDEIKVIGKGYPADKGVTVENDLTIPADRTVINQTKITFDGDLTIDEGAKFTNQGSVVMAGDKASITVNGTMDNSAVAADGLSFTEENGNVYVSGEFIASNATAITGATGYDINGTYYDKQNGTWAVTTFAKAAAAVAAMDGNQTITTIGKVSESGDVTLSGDKSQINGDVTLGTVTLANASIEVKNGDGVKFSATVAGAYGADGSTSDATATLSNAKNMTVTNTSSTDSMNVKTWFNTINTVGSDKGGVTITAGEFQLTGGSEITLSLTKENYLRVSSGATLVIPAKQTVNMGGEGLAVEGTIAVNGTLNINDDSTIAGNADVKGTMTVAEKDSSDAAVTLTVTGTITVSADDKDKASLTVNGRLNVGAVPGTLGAATGSVNGTVTVTGTIVVYAGATVADAKIMANANDECKPTEFVVNDISYATAYGAGTVSMLDSEIIGLKDIKDTNNNGTKISSIDWYAEGQTGTVNTANIGVYAQVTSTLAWADVAVTISAGPGLEIYIDDVRMSGEMHLDVGEHTVTVYVKSGYEGTPQVTFNGQAISGTFTLTSSMIGENNVIYATGATPIDYTQGGSTGGDDSGMGLVEILLVILVIVVVILAIIVVLRMMRS